MFNVLDKTRVVGPPPLFWGRRNQKKRSSPATIPFLVTFEFPEKKAAKIIADTDALDHSIGAVLEQKDDQGNRRPCAFCSRNLQNSVQYDAYRNVLGYMGRRAWSVREKQTYTLSPVF